MNGMLPLDGSHWLNRLSPPSLYAEDSSLPPLAWMMVL